MFIDPRQHHVDFIDPKQRRRDAGTRELRPRELETVSSEGEGRADEPLEQLSEVSEAGAIEEIDEASEVAENHAPDNVRGQRAKRASG